MDLDRNTKQKSGRWQALVALGLYAACWISMWGPMYAGREGIGPYIWPVVFIALIPILILAVVGLVKGGRAQAFVPDGDPRRPAAIQAMVISAVILFGGLPFLWFGNLPYVLATGDSGFGAE